MATFEDFNHKVEIGDLDSVKTILKEQSDLIAGKGKGNFAIMHGAAMSENEELVNFLIENGADINARNDKGITPLHVVLYPEIAQILIDKGADVNALSDEGETPLHSMAGESDEVLDVVEVLLRNGADKSIKRKDGKTAYDLAKMKGNIDLMEALR